MARGNLTETWKVMGSNSDGPKSFLSENCKLNFNKHFKFNNQIEESYDLKYFMVF